MAYGSRVLHTERNNDLLRPQGSETEGRVRRCQHGTPYNRHTALDRYGGQFRKPEAALRCRKDCGAQRPKRDPAPLFRHTHGQCRDTCGTQACQGRGDEAKGQAGLMNQIVFVPPIPSEAVGHVVGRTFQLILTAEIWKFAL